jgi:hypothetical protein
LHDKEIQRHRPLPTRLGPRPVRIVAATGCEPDSSGRAGED